MGFSDPRAKSVPVSAGKRDGVSGPGVGSMVRMLQDGGVGKTMFVTAVVTSAGFEGVDVQEAATNSEVNRVKNFSLLMFIALISPELPSEVPRTRS